MTNPRVQPCAICGGPGFVQWDSKSDWLCEEHAHTKKTALDAPRPTAAGPLTAKFGDVLDAAIALVMCKHDGRVMNEDDDGYVCQYCGAEIEDLRHNPEAKWKRPQFTQRLAEAIGVP